MRINSCRICQKEDLEVVLDYGEVALADGFLENMEEIKNEEKYPLRLCICNNCKHLQIDEIVDPGLLFRNYVYETGVSSSIKKFAEELYKSVIDCYDSVAGGKKAKVLEVASNDGTVLSIFKRENAEVLGIDPAKNIAEAANSRGIKTLARFFNADTASDVADEYGKWDICIARNVMAHVNALHSFAEGIKLLLDKSGFAVIEVPHLKTMFEELQYDQVFHEHIGFHSLDSFIKLFKFYDMEVFHVEELWVHGGSIRVYLQHVKGPRKINPSVSGLLDREDKIGLFEKTAWHEFAERVLKHKVALREELNRLKMDNRKIAVYGASGKGQSLLQFCGLDKKIIEYVVDKSKMKQGKITPGTHIEVFSPSHIYEDLPDVILICAWNFADEIVKQEERFASLGGRFLHPLPLPHYL